MFYSIWWPQLAGETSDVPPDRCANRSRGSSSAPSGRTWTSGAIRSTSRIRALAKIDAKPYMAMSKWATQFYERRPAREVPRPHENEPRRSCGARAHRDRHAGMPGRRRRPERRAGRTRRGGAPRGVPNIERLLPAARAAGVKVVHCLVQRRPDGLGANHNAKIFAIGGDVDIIPGSPGRVAAARTRACANRCRAAPVARHRPDGRHRPRRRPAQSRCHDHRRRRRLGQLAITNLVMDAVNLATASSCRATPSPASPPTTQTRSSTTRCRCWRRSPPPTTSSRCGSSRDRNRKREHRLSGNQTIDAGPELGRFMTAMRRLQDIVVSTNPDDALWADAAGQIEDLCARFEVHRAPQGVAPAGRGPHLPGLGHPLMPPWTIDRSRARRGDHARALQPLPRRRQQRRPRWRDTAVLRLALRHDRLRRGPPEQPNRLPARGLPQDHARSTNHFGPTGG